MKSLVSAIALMTLVGCSTTTRNVQEVFNTAPLFNTYPAGTEFVSNWGVPVGRGMTAKVAAPALSSTPAAAQPAAVAAAPATDTDGDGVADSKDKCANTTANTVVNAYGCAKTEKASIRLQVQFAPGSTTLDASSQAEVKKLGEFLAEFPAQVWRSQDTPITPEMGL